VDRRTLAANEFVASDVLIGVHDHHTYVKGIQKRIVVPIVDLCAEPNGPRDRQLVAGDMVLEFDQRDGWSFIQNTHDGYVGYIRSDVLSLDDESTHWVANKFAIAYRDPSFKSRETALLPMGARLCVTAEKDGYLFCEYGWVPAVQLRSIKAVHSDPASIAEMLLGTPYLWGGNSPFGIDCSGLVQLAFKMCGVSIPADSDQQCATFGEHVNSDDFCRNDVLFWRGHVALVVDNKCLIHANAFQMAVTFEAIEPTCARIKANGDGDLIAHKRFNLGQ
jgi:cell wall-associated NlpC family hydrolase